MARSKKQSAGQNGSAVVAPVAKAPAIPANQLCEMTLEVLEEKKTCFAYRRIAAEDHLTQVFVGKPETLYIRKDVLTGCAGRKLRVIIQVI